SMSQPLAADNPGAANAPEPGGVQSAFDRDIARLKIQLGDQIERQALREARHSVIALLCLDPLDAAVLPARALIDEQPARAPPHPVGEVRTLAGHKHWVNCVVFSPDGLKALSGGGGDARAASNVRGGLDRSIRLWDVEAGKELRRYLG